MATQTTSDFYWACRNGDVDTVKNILPNLKANDINRIESNGSTALHAASYYGHANVVRLLIAQGANITIRDKYEKTAKEEASTDEVRSMFESTVNVEEEADDDNDEMPQSKFVQLYRNAEGIDKSVLATRALKARLSTYQAHKYTISATSNLEHLEKKFYKLCKGDENNFLKCKEYFDKYRETGDFDHMVRLYTTESPFYQMIHGDETFLVEMYKHLLRYEKYIFQGRTYRGTKLLPEDVAPYQWALAHSQSILEMRRMTSTSKIREVAICFCINCSRNGQHILFEMEFTEPCFTVIDLKSLSEYSSEEEVLVLSGTFFEVTGIQEGDGGLIIISLKNVRVDKSISSVLPGVSRGPKIWERVENFCKIC